jgi:Restriction endonuclease
MADKKWKQFEKSVAAFIAALAPEARVTHDADIPDIDTGKLRQRDVWIETKVCNHFSVKILVSCKRYKKKIDQQQMDAFIGEIRSSGAHKGVMYSFSGFTRPALRKAEKVGISCCRLYDFEAPDIPDVLMFDAYLLTPTFHFFATRTNSSATLPETIGELLDLELPIDSPQQRTLFIDILEEKYYESRQIVRNRSRETGELPTDWTDSITITKSELDKVFVEFGGSWDIYEARLEGVLVSGSYSFTETEFKGEQLFPCIDKRGPDPGSGWKKINALPECKDKPIITGILYGGKVTIREPLYEKRDLPLPELESA